MHYRAPSLKTQINQARKFSNTYRCANTNNNRKHVLAAEQRGSMKIMNVMMWIITSLNIKYSKRFLKQRRQKNFYNSLKAKSGPLNKSGRHISRDKTPLFFFFYYALLVIALGHKSHSSWQHFLSLGLFISNSVAAGVLNDGLNDRAQSYD